MSGNQNELGEREPVQDSRVEVTEETSKTAGQQDVQEFRRRFGDRNELRDVEGAPEQAREALDVQEEQEVVSGRQQPIRATQAPESVEVRASEDTRRGISPATGLALRDEQAETAARGEREIARRAQEGDLQAQLFQFGEEVTRTGQRLGEGVTDRIPLEGVGPRVSLPGAERNVPIGTQAETVIQEVVEDPFFAVGSGAQAAATAPTVVQDRDFAQVAEQSEAGAERQIEFAEEQPVAAAAFLLGPEAVSGDATTPGRVGEFAQSAGGRLRSRAPSVDVSTPSTPSVPNVEVSLQRGGDVPRVQVESATTPRDLVQGAQLRARRARRDAPTTQDLVADIGFTISEARAAARNAPGETAGRIREGVTGARESLEVTTPDVRGGVRRAGERAALAGRRVRRDIPSRSELAADIGFTIQQAREAAREQTVGRIQRARRDAPSLQDLRADLGFEASEAAAGAGGFLPEAPSFGGGFLASERTGRPTPLRFGVIERGGQAFPDISRPRSLQRAEITGRRLGRRASEFRADTRFELQQAREVVSEATLGRARRVRRDAPSLQDLRADLGFEASEAAAGAGGAVGGFISSERTGRPMPFASLIPEGEAVSPGLPSFGLVSGARQRVRAARETGIRVDIGRPERRVVDAEMFGVTGEEGASGLPLDVEARMREADPTGMGREPLGDVRQLGERAERQGTTGQQQLLTRVQPRDPPSLDAPGRLPLPFSPAASIDVGVTGLFEGRGVQSPTLTPERGEERVQAPDVSEMVVQTPEQTPEQVQSPEQTPEQTPEITPELSPELTPEQRPEPRPEPTPRPPVLPPFFEGGGRRRDEESLGFRFGERQFFRPVTSPGQLLGLGSDE